MRKYLLAVVAIVSLSFGHAQAESQTQTSTPKKKTVSSKKAAVSKAQKPKRIPKTASRRNTTVEPTASLEDAKHLALFSSSVVVQDQTTGSILFEKNAGAVLPIASITKLMTAMVSLDAQPSLTEVMRIDEEDVDTLKGTRSRLKVGTQLTREEMLRLALMSSENRAASALSRYYNGGRPAFVAAMNRKAAALGLVDTHFSDSTGLTSANVSSARDLVKMVAAAHQYPLIREFSTTPEYDVMIGGRQQSFHNTNILVRNSSWDIGLSKTGFINEAGKCLVMQTWLNHKPTIIVLLDSWGKMTRIGDAQRIKRWMENVAFAQKPNPS